MQCGNKPAAFRAESCRKRFISYAVLLNTATPPNSPRPPDCGSQSNRSTSKDEVVLISARRRPNLATAS